MVEETLAITCTRTTEYAILWVANESSIRRTRKAPKLQLGGFSVPILQAGTNA